MHAACIDKNCFGSALLQMKAEMDLLSAFILSQKIQSLRGCLYLYVGVHKMLFNFLFVIINRIFVFGVIFM